MQTFTGIQYLQIDIANSFGLDKEIWENRLAWFAQNEHQLEHLVSKAKEPAMFHAGVQAYREVQCGNPIGYMASLDATSSGLQILACLTGDRKTAELCNVIDVGYRENAYKALHDAMISQTGLGSGITLEMAKQAIMTAFYGSTAEPKRVFGEGELLTVFNDTMATMAPAAWDLNQFMLQIWDPNALEYSWVMPDNFHVNTKVMNHVHETVNVMGEPFEVTYKENAPTEQGRALGANMTHSVDGFMVREMTRRCDYDPIKVHQILDLVEAGVSGDKATVTDDDHLVCILWDHYQNSGYLSARILDHINANNLGHVDRDAILELIGTLPAKPFKLVSVHDCFRFLPHYGDDVRRQYNLQLTLIARSNLLQDLLSQITNRKMSISKLDMTLQNETMQANYALS